MKTIDKILTAFLIFSIFNIAVAIYINVQVKSVRTLLVEIGNSKVGQYGGIR